MSIYETKQHRKSIPGMTADDLSEGACTSRIVDQRNLQSDKDTIKETPAARRPHCAAQVRRVSRWLGKPSSPIASISLAERVTSRKGIPAPAVRRPLSRRRPVHMVCLVCTLLLFLASHHAMRNTQYTAHRRTDVGGQQLPGHISEWPLTRDAEGHPVVQAWP